MNNHAKAGVLALLTTPLIVGILWIGSGAEKPASLLPVVSSQSTSAVTAINSAPPIAPVAQATPAAPAVGATPVAKPVVLTPEERQFILAEFVKAADKDIAKVQHALEDAKASGAPAEQIAAQENKLRMMQQFKLNTLARNAG